MSRTTPTTAPPPEDSATATVFSRHWSGQWPLARSFWLAFLLPLALAGSALGALATWLVVRGEMLQAGSIVLLLGWPATAALAIWGAVGVWRASAAPAGRSRQPAPALAARAAVVLGLAALAAAAVVHVAPRVPDLLSLALGRDPAGHVQATLTPDGRRLHLTGPLGLGDGSRVARMLLAAPQARLVELRSEGGRIAEALALAEAVRERRALTRIVGPCGNACVLVFMAGAARQIMPSGHVALHREPAPSLNPLWRGWAHSLQAAQWKSAGLPEAFVLNTLSSPPASPWAPEAEEWLAAGLVGVPERPLDVPLPAAAGARPPEYGEALAGNRVWQALEKRFPGSISAAAARMASAHAGAGGDEAAQVAGQAVAQALVPTLLLDASPEMREQFLALLAEQLVAARADVANGGQRCRALLAGDAATTHGLPPALAQREAAWLYDAATEPPRATAARRASELELEVVRRTLGERAPVLLAGLTRPAQAEGRGPACELAAALIGEVLQLPGAERRLALRVMFDR